MKLQNELQGVIDRFDQLAKSNDIQAYIEKIKESGRYSNLQVRVAWALLHASGCPICLWYTKYGCNDTHVQTLALKALESLNLKF